MSSEPAGWHASYRKMFSKRWMTALVGSGSIYCLCVVVFGYERVPLLVDSVGALAALCSVGAMYKAPVEHFRVPAAEHRIFVRRSTWGLLAFAVGGLASLGVGVLARPEVRIPIGVGAVIAMVAGWVFTSRVTARYLASAEVLQRQRQGV